MANDVAIQTALIAGAVALIVAIITQTVSVINQILTHRLTQARETQKYYNEIYQMLFAPVVSDAFLYFDMISNFRRGHDTTPEMEREVKNKVIGHIGNNLIYASPHLISAHHEIATQRFKDETGFDPLSSEIRLIAEFIDEYKYTIQHSSIYTGRILNKQVAAIDWYRLLALLLANNQEKLLIFSFWFNRDTDINKKIKQLQRIFRDNRSRYSSLWEASTEFERKLETELMNKSAEERSAMWNHTM